MFGLAQEIVSKQFLGQLCISNNFNNILSLAGNALGVRFASKKTGGSSKNRISHCRPKHRKVLKGDNEFVQKGMILVKQNKLRFHPGLNVGFGYNGSLFALEAGRVKVTCEKIDPKMEHTWIVAHYAGRDLSSVHKKYFNVIPEKEHNIFKEVDAKSTTSNF